MQNKGRFIDVAMQTNPGMIEEYHQMTNTITNEKDQMEKKLEEHAEVNTNREKKSSNTLRMKARAQKYWPKLIPIWD